MRIHIYVRVYLRLHHVCVCVRAPVCVPVLVHAFPNEHVRGACMLADHLRFCHHFCLHSIPFTLCGICCILMGSCYFIGCTLALTKSLPIAALIIAMCRRVSLQHAPKVRGYRGRV
mmetsp:Transcript_49847/g.82720  ORF Transcript_49847/g.82720 Transcript_49847/m.82720 type:complete len:116 (+) Transcript_49847:132-479(+)